MSWVRKVRHIQDVAPWLQPEPRHKSEDEQLRIYDRNLQKAFPVLGKAPVARDHRPYFGSTMRDSWAMTLERKPTKLILTLNGFNPWCFARGVDELFGTQRGDQPWPVHLVAHGVTDFRLVRHDPVGKLRTVPIPQSVALDEFGVDWGWREADRIAWVFILRSTEFDAEERYGLVDCARLTARDESRHRIADVYGPTLGRMFEEMLGLRKTPVPLLEHQGFWVEGPERYVRARAKTLGLSLEQIAEEIWERKRVRG